MKNNRILLNWKTLFAVALLLVGIQNGFAQQSRYTNRTLRVAFQTPPNTVQDPESTDRRIIFNADQSEFGLATSLEFIADDSPDAQATSDALGDERGFEMFVKKTVDTVKSGLDNAEIKILEKKRVKIAGLNAVKIILAVKIDKIKLRLASFSVTVPEHERMYNFIAGALDENFDKWLPVAQRSIDSFEILKAVPKSAHE